MATRYWVGGAGTWDASTTTNWSATSGGAGGASAPTSVDDVIFDTSSGTGTIAFSGVCVCNNLTITATQALSLSTGTLYGIYGSLSLPTGGSVIWGCPTTFRATTTGKTLNWGDKSSPQNITFDGVGGGWTFTSNFTTTGSIVLTNGTVSTNGYTITVAQISTANSNIRTLNLNGSTINLSFTNPFSYSATNLTLNTGTSTLNCTSSSAVTFTGGGYTWYNINFTGGGTTTIAVTGANTFNNLSFTATTAGTKNITFDSTTTINGTLSTSGTTAANRIQFQSSVAGTQRTLSVATIGTLTNTNFQDIALTGAASPWTAPVGVWNFGNNSGITFDTTTLYWIGGGGDWYSSAKWSTSSGGSTAGAIPGPQNNIVIDSNSGTGTITTTVNPVYCNDYTVSATQAITSTGINYSIYGSFVTPVAGSFSVGGGSVTFAATTTGKTITQNGKGFAYGVNFSGVGGEWTLQSNFDAGNGINITAGTFRSNNYNINSGQAFSISGSLTKAVYLGSSTVSNAAGTMWSAVATNTTFDAGTSTITGTSSEQTFAGGGLTYYNVAISAGAVITGANTFTNLTFTAPSTQSRRIILYANQVVTGTFTATGANGNQRLMVIPDTQGQQRTITAAAVSLVDVDFYNFTGAGAATWSGTRLGNGGQNVNVTFATPKTVYWNLAAGGDWLTANAWATTSGGTPATTNYPLPQDTAIFENTGLNTSATITTGSTNAGAFLSAINFSARTNAVTFSISQTNLYFAGGITLGSGVTVSGPTTVYISNATTLTSAGRNWPAPITVAPAATLTFADATTLVSASLTISAGATATLNANVTQTISGNIIVSGTLNLNSYTLQGWLYQFNAASVTNFGTGKIISVMDNGYCFFGSNTQTVTGSAVIECATSATTGVRYISTGNPTEANAFNVKITSGSDTISMSGAMVKNLDFTGFTGTLATGTRTIYGDLVVSSGMTLTAGTSVTTFAATSGTKTITTNGKTLDFPITFNGVGGTWQLADNLTQGSTREVILTNGTVDLNAKTFTIGQFTTTAGTKNLTFNGGVLLVTASGVNAFANNAPTGFTTTAGTGTGKISLNSATAKSFKGGGATYNCTLENAGAGALTITGANTFTTISNSVQPTSFLFTAGTTTTVTNFNVSGTSGNLVTIGSDTTASHTLSKASGIVSVQYCSISRSTATGGATWQAYTANGNVDGGNNSGWLFSEFTANGLFFGSNF